jgi:hypothetical protein
MGKTKVLKFVLLEYHMERKEYGAEKIFEENV